MLLTTGAAPCQMKISVVTSKMFLICQIMFFLSCLVYYMSTFFPISNTKNKY